MRLSEAIALGRVMVNELKAKDLHGCALGMAANAVGISRCYCAIEAAWPWLKLPAPGPNCCNHVPTTARDSMSYIWHLFDSHVMRLRDWTLDQLIDWVRANEPEETPQIEQPQTESPVEVAAAHERDVR